MRDSFTFSDNTQIIAIPYSEILYLIADGNYTKIHLKDGKVRVYTQSLRHALEKLDSNKFCRIHRSCVVNVSKVVCNEKGRTGTAIMADGEHLSVAEAQKALFLKTYGT